MGRNLGPLNIKDSYQELVQISGSILTDGVGLPIDNLSITASHATTADASISASYAQTSTSASHALVADVALNVPATASYALYAEVAGFATSSLSASHADNSDSSLTSISASYALTSTSASHANNSDSSLTAISASYAVTASYALNAGSSTLEEVLTAGNTATNNIILTGSYQRVSGSFSGSVIDNITDTYTTTTAVQHVISLTQAEYNAIVTKDPSTFYMITDSEATMITGSVSGDTLTFSKSDGSTFPLTIASVSSSISSSYAVSSSHSDISDSSLTAISASYALTASYLEGGVPTPTLQQVTDAGNTTTNLVSAAGFNGGYLIPLAGDVALGTITGDVNIQAAGAVKNVNIEATNKINMTGSVDITGSLGVTGSVVGNVNVLTDAGGTTTMDCSLSNFFTLAMPAGGSTTLTPTNITAGQTINVKITQNATPSTIAFATSVDFEGGTPFAVSTGAGEVDVMTFISFDGTSLQATGLKNFS